MSREILHQFNDPSYKYLVRTLRDSPAYESLIKYASLDPGYPETLPETCFAWPERRLFPVDNEDNAVLSWMYAEKNAEVPEDIKDEIKKALELYDVELPKTEKVAETRVKDPVYVLPEQKRWKISSDENLKQAMDALFNNSRKMPLETRTQAAVNIIKMASTVEDQQVKRHVLNDKTLAKYAGVTASDLNIVREWIGARVCRAEDNFKPLYIKMAESLEGVKSPVYDRSSLTKLATTIHDVDQRAGLDKLYGHKLLDPILTVFNMDKFAENTVDLAGVDVPMSTLMSVPTETYEDIFGEDITPEISTDGELDSMKLGSILDTMPRDLKVVLRKQLGC